MSRKLYKPAIGITYPIIQVNHSIQKTVTHTGKSEQCKISSTKPSEGLIC